MPLYTSRIKYMALLILPCISCIFFTLNDHPSLLGHSNQQIVMCYFFCLKNNYLTLLLTTVSLHHISVFLIAANLERGV